MNSSGWRRATSAKNFFATARFNISIGRPQIGLYVLGTIGAVGSVLGRLPCGWLCPFGLVQDLIYKIPSPKLRIPRPFTAFRHVVLAVMVLALPLLAVLAVLASRSALGGTGLRRYLAGEVASRP